MGGVLYGAPTSFIYSLFGHYLARQGQKYIINVPIHTFSYYFPIIATSADRHCHLIWIININLWTTKRRSAVDYWISYEPVSDKNCDGFNVHRKRVSKTLIKLLRLKMKKWNSHIFLENWEPLFLISHGILQVFCQYSTILRTSHVFSIRLQISCNAESWPSLKLWILTV